MLRKFQEFCKTMKTMKNKDDEYSIIIKDLKFIYSNYYLSSGMIKQCKFPNYNEESKLIGNEKYRVSRENYADDFVHVGDESKYFIELKDESLISVRYLFDEEKNLVSFESNLLFKNKDDFSILSKYIRIDYDNEGYKTMVHPKIHLHNNLERDGLRIPLNNIVYPSEFVYLILRYYYDFDWTILKKNLIYYQDKKEFLTDEEKSLFFLKLNENNQT